jgi:hypothetical protein
MNQRPRRGVRLLNHGKGSAVEPAARAPGGSEIRQLPHSYIGAFRQVSGQGQLLAASPRFEVRHACHRVNHSLCMSIRSDRFVLHRVARSSAK